MTDPVRRATTSDLAHAVWRQWVEQDPDRVAICSVVDSVVTEVTYQEFGDLARHLSIRLVAAGAGPGSFVGGMLGRGAMPWIAALACWQIGSVYVPIHEGVGKRRIASLAEQLPLTCVVLDDDVPVAAAEAVATLNRGSANVIEVTRDVSRAEQWTQNSREQHVVASREGPSHDAPAVLMFTSGSTGEPKACVISHSGLAAVHGYTQETLARFKSRVVVNTAEPAWSYGLLTIGCSALARGVTMVVCGPRFNAEDTLRAVAATGADTIAGAPTAFARLSGATAVAQRTSSLRLTLTAGEPMDDRAALDWGTRSGSIVIDGYGLTEMGMAMAGPLFSPRGAVNGGRPGLRVLEGWEARLDPHGEGARNTGVLRVRTAIPLTQRVLGSPTPEVDADGWFATQDVFTRDERGLYRFLRRADDVLLVSGVNVSGLAVQGVVEAHPKVKQAVVFGVGEPGVSRRIAVAVVPAAPNNPPSTDDLRSSIAEQIGRHAVPEVVLVLDEMPLTSNGKVDSVSLRQLADECQA